MPDSQFHISTRRRIGIVFVMLMTTGFATVTMEASNDLSGRSLAHSDYSGRDLRAANLTNAHLAMADFSNADLRGADFRGAKLDRINLDGADLRGVIGWAKADLGLGISANGANFSGTDLRNAKLVGGYSGGYFERADFTNADLTGATLTGRFDGARFQGAKLGGTLMLGAVGVELIRNDLRRRGAIVVGVDFAAAVKSGRDFSNSFLPGAQLQDVDLAGAKLGSANLHSANFDRAQLDGADLRGANLHHATAKDARFDDANLSESHFHNVNANGASFVGAKLVNASLFRTDLSGANLRDADLTGANLSYADLTGADLTGATLDDVAVEAAIFDDVRGLPPETQRKLTERAGRWKYDLEMGVNDFLQNWSFRLHLVLTPVAIVLGLMGFRGGRARTSFAVMTGINLATVIPLLIGWIFAMLGGSPTAQMSEPNLWGAWFSLWPVMMLGLGILFLGSLAAGGYQIVRYVIMTPRNRPFLSLNCVLLTVANCFFAGIVLLMMAPDA